MKRLNPVSLLTISLLLLSCDDELPVDQGSSGKISGDVELYLQNGEPAIDDSGVTVSIKGTSLSGTSGADGRWTIEHVSPGVHTIVFEKPGYGRMETQNVQFVGQDDYFVGQQYLGEIPTFSVTSYNVEIEPYGNPGSGYYSVSILGTLSIPGRSVGIFYKTDPNTVFRYTASERIATGFIGYEPDPATTFLATFSLSTSYVPSGTTVYIQIVPITNHSDGPRYYDFEAQEYFITGLWLGGASPAIPITVP